MLFSKKMEKTNAPSELPWYEQMAGAFENDEIFDRAMEAGAAYRRSQPTAAEEIEALECQGLEPGKTKTDAESSLFLRESATD